MNSSMERKRPRRDDEPTTHDAKKRRSDSVSDAGSPQNQAMIQRCMQRYNWTLDYGTEVFEAFWIFLGLKKAIADWDGTKLAAPLPIDRMWRDALLDTRKYSEDCVSVFGRMIHYNPDRNFDAPALKARLERTMTMVQLRFGANGYDRKIWRLRGSSGDTTTPAPSVSPFLTSSTNRLASTGSFSGSSEPASLRMASSSSDSRSSNATAKPKPAATAKPKPTATAQTMPTSHAMRPKQTTGTISQPSNKTTVQQQQKVSSRANASATKDRSQQKATAARPASRPSSTSTLADGGSRAKPSCSKIPWALIIAHNDQKRRIREYHAAKLAARSTNTLSKQTSTAAPAWTASYKNGNGFGNNTRDKTIPTLQKAAASLPSAVSTPSPLLVSTSKSPSVLSKEANTRDLVAKPKPVATQEAAAAARRASIPPVRKNSSTGSGASNTSRSVQPATMGANVVSSFRSGPRAGMYWDMFCCVDLPAQWLDMYGPLPNHIGFWHDPVANMIHMPKADMDDSNVVFITVSRAKSPDSIFKFGKKTKLCNLFAVYEHRRNFLSPSVTFTMNGQKLDGNDTPETAGMDPGTCVKIRAKYGRKKKW